MPSVQHMLSRMKAIAASLIAMLLVVFAYQPATAQPPAQLTYLPAISGKAKPAPAVSGCLIAQGKPVPDQIVQIGQTYIDYSLDDAGRTDASGCFNIPGQFGYHSRGQYYLRWAQAESPATDPTRVRHILRLFSNFDIDTQTYGQANVGTIDLSALLLTGPPDGARVKMPVIFSFTPYDNNSCSLSLNTLDGLVVGAAFGSGNPGMFTLQSDFDPKYRGVPLRWSVDCETGWVQSVSRTVIIE
jgi:hypothetical protein